MDVFDSEGISNCYDAESNLYALGSFESDIYGKGGLRAEAPVGLTLHGDDSIVGKYVGLSDENGIYLCCTVEIKHCDKDEGRLLSSLLEETTPLLD